MICRLALRVVIVAASTLVIALPFPGYAQGDEGTGACLFLDVGTGRGQFGGGAVSVGGAGTFDFCVDGATPAECDDFCLNPGPEPNNYCFWFADELCTDQNFDWDGACDVPDFACVLIFADDSGASENLCLGVDDATWHPDAVVCEGQPVPAIPTLMLPVLLMLLLLAFVVAIRSRGDLPTLD